MPGTGRPATLHQLWIDGCHRRDWARRIGSSAATVLQRRSVVARQRRSSLLRFARRQCLGRGGGSPAWLRSRRSIPRRPSPSMPGLNPLERQRIAPILACRASAPIATAASGTAGARRTRRRRWTAAGSGCSRPATSKKTGLSTTCAQPASSLSRPTQRPAGSSRSGTSAGTCAATSMAGCCVCLRHRRRGTSWSARPTTTRVSRIWSRPESLCRSPVTFGRCNSTCIIPGSPAPFTSRSTRTTISFTRSAFDMIRSLRSSSWFAPSGSCVPTSRPRSSIPTLGAVCLSLRMVPGARPLSRGLVRAGSLPHLPARHCDP